MGAADATLTLNELERGSAKNNNHQNEDTSLTVPQSPYRDECVTPKLRQQPWLGILDEFLDPENVHFAISKSRRMFYFDIEVVHVTTRGKVNAPIPCHNIEQFKLAVRLADDEICGTIVIAKDLSRAMIDALGMEFDLEPDFFANHLQGTESFRMGHWEVPTVRAPALLPDFLRKSPYYFVSYRRPYRFLDGLKTAIKLRSTKTCIPRGTHVLTVSLPDVFVFENISVYKRKGAKIGVVLTDQLLSEEPPAPYILDAVSSLDEGPGPCDLQDRHLQVSARANLVRWLRKLPPQDAATLFDDHETLLLRPTLKIVEKASAMFLTHARYTMSRIVTQHCDEEFPDNIPFAVRVSRSLYRHIHDQRNIQTKNLRVALLKGGKEVEEQARDIQFLVDDMEGTLKALKEDVRFLVSSASIGEGRLVTLISKFAFLFLPVTTLATILSISDPGYIRFAILGGLAVPFGLISLFFMFFWKPSDIDSISVSYKAKRS